MTVDVVFVSQVVLAGLVSLVFTGIAAFGFQKFLEDRITRKLESFRADLQLTTFARRSWWERKAEAYSEIITQLINLQRDYAQLEYIAHYYMADDGIDENEVIARLKTHESQAQTLMESTIATGAYIVSDDTLTVLHEFQRTLASNPFKDEFFPHPVPEEIWYGWLAGIYEQAIDKVRQCAKKDLQVD